MGGGGLGSSLNQTQSGARNGSGDAASGSGLVLKRFTELTALDEDFDSETPPFRRVAVGNKHSFCVSRQRKTAVRSLVLHGSKSAQVLTSSALLGCGGLLLYCTGLP